MPGPLPGAHRSADVRPADRERAVSAPPAHALAVAAGFFQRMKSSINPVSTS